jgi:hypothetical protein
MPQHGVLGAIATMWLQALARYTKDYTELPILLSTEFKRMELTSDQLNLTRGRSAFQRGPGDTLPASQ